jgi:hypothetical protein
MTGDQAIQNAYIDLLRYADAHAQHGDAAKADVMRFAAAIVLRQHSDADGFRRELAAAKSS